MVHRSPEGEFWLIDPLDGTKEFISRNGEFTVNVALIENGVPVFGIVLAPCLDLLYLGGTGSGAFYEKAGVSKACPCRSRQIRLIGRWQLWPVEVA